MKVYVRSVAVPASAQLGQQARFGGQPGGRPDADNWWPKSVGRVRQADMGAR